MSADRQANQMRLQALLALGLIGQPKFGLVTTYDPSTHSVKVMIQPEGYETGLLPIQVLQAGAGWGVYAPPQNGDQAIVLFQEGDKEAGWCAGFLPNEVDQPPEVPQGEIWLVHRAGAYLKFLTDGTVSLVATAGIKSQGPWTHIGTLHVTDVVSLDKDLNVAGAAIFTGSSVTHGGVNIGKTHVHSGVQTGSGVSAGPQ